MKHYHGNRKTKNYFEGWFFRHSFRDENIAFIPSMAIDEDGHRFCYLQVIANHFSHTFEFPISGFTASESRLFITIGNNTFSEGGIHVNVKDDECQVTADLAYTPFWKITGDIMGIFACIPFMECNHGIESMKHKVNGTITLNGHMMEIADGSGYIETDYGASFPNKYLWLQCNDFQEDAAFFLSRATIPFLGFRFQGFICSLIYGRKEYRFATYNGAKVVKAEANLIALKKGKTELSVTYNKENANQLKAPVTGNMKRIIHECLNGTCSITLLQKGTKIVTLVSKNSGIEAEM